MDDWILNPRVADALLFAVDDIRREREYQYMQQQIAAEQDRIAALMAPTQNDRR